VHRKRYIMILIRRAYKSTTFSHVKYSERFSEACDRVGLKSLLMYPEWEEVES
jgi:hypothetical protein